MANRLSRNDSVRGKLRREARHRLADRQLIQKCGEGETVSKMGRPRKELDAEQIVRFIGKGFTVEWVADYFSVATSTLYLNYSEAIKKGRVFKEGCLQAKQFHTAMVKGNVTMQIWLGKQWLKQTDKVAVEDDKPPLPLGMEEFE